MLEQDDRSLQMLCDLLVSFCDLSLFFFHFYSELVLFAVRAAVSCGISLRLFILFIPGFKHLLIC